MNEERPVSTLEKLTLFGMMLDGGYVIYSFFIQHTKHMMFSIILFLVLLTIHIITMVLEDKRNENFTRL